MPRTAVRLLEGSVAQHRSCTPTLLYSWLKARGLSQAKFARQIGCDPKSVMFWCDGRSLPDYVYTFVIEKATGGGVPVSSWLATPIGKLLWNERMRQSQRGR